MARPTAIDVFSGAGGLSLGLRNAGFAVLAGADSDPWAVETHTANLGGLGFAGDLTDPEEFLEHLDSWGIKTVDLVAGGPPCQPFSRAGSSKIRQLVAAGGRSADDPRASLWRSFIAVVERLRPRAVLIENVPDLPGWDDGAVLIGFYETLRGLGYEVEARVLDAYRFGVPQHRARLFIVALRGLNHVWPTAGEEAPSLRDAIGDLPPVPPAQREECVPYWGTPDTRLARALRADVPEAEREVIFDHITRAVRPDDAEAFRLLAQGQTYADLPKRLQRYRSDIFDDKYKRLTWDEVSRSITAHIAKDGYWYIHPEQHRTLSIREAARVQTFPDWFRFAGEPTHRLRQIGNAVPPLLGEAVGTAIRRALEAPSRQRRSQRAAEHFRQDLMTWHEDAARSYPWRRRGISPWEVLMAEMCLHRTRADQVAPVFEKLCRLAPTPKAMVEREDEALDVMKSLGLRWRAKNIIRVAHAILDDFCGEVPDTELSLRNLPGVGDYVAQAVLCFAFGRRSVIVDTNTARIASRISGHDDQRRWQLRLDIYRMAGAEGPDGKFNYALLDLGALICKAGRPRCEDCPVREHCTTGSQSTPRLQLQLTEGIGL